MKKTLFIAAACIAIAGVGCTQDAQDIASGTSERPVPASWHVAIA